MLVHVHFEYAVGHLKPMQTVKSVRLE